MLQSLFVENYALIRSLEIRFEPGFVAITGETGAGKSILMGALSLILGSRADTDVLYDTSKKCIVEGVFDVSDLPVKSFFEQNDLDYQEQTTIRREINEHGKSRAFINDTPVNLATLKSLTATLIDIHSQHQNLLLQDSDFRLHILDQYAQTADLLSSYQASLSRLHEAQQEEKRLREFCTNAALERDFQLFTIQELETANLQVDEQQDVEQRIRMLSHAEDIKMHLFRASQMLSEQEGDTVLQQLKTILSECANLSDIGPEYKELHDRLKSVELELQDIAYEISHKENDVEVNPQELDRLNERIDLIYTLEHKYQVENVQDLLDLKQKLQEKVNDYTDNQEQLSKIVQDIAKLQQETKSLACQLSAARAKVLPKLAKDMQGRLVKLGMEDAQFEIHLTKSSTLHQNGMDGAEFWFSANKGVAPADLGKIASGGEISRVMLALKSIITDARLLPTVIFDEIDTGISGETANKVGHVMQLLAHNHQVVAITHLPQIASKGQQHFLVYKEIVENKTITKIKELHAEERVQAIAGMLSGSSYSQSALATAREMLQCDSSIR